MDSDFYRLFSHFWWLVFPLFWMIAGMGRLWSRHVQAQKTLDMIKSYVDQGKEPPPELVQALQSPTSLGGKDASDMAQIGKWVPLGLFTALSLGFLMLAFSSIGQEDKNAMPGLIFVAMIMAGLAAGFLASILAGRKRNQGRERRQ